MTSVVRWGCFGTFAVSGVPRGGVWGVQTPAEILKISVESSIA